MQLTVNGETRETAATTLAELLVELEYRSNWLATARNGEIVCRRDRPNCRLTAGDRIEILAPIGGG